MKFRFWEKLILISAFVLAVGGCQTQKSRKPSPDWSRGGPLGFSALGSVGMLHLLWFDGEQILYARLPDGILGTAVGAPIADIRKGPSDSLVGPALGLTDDRAYAVWSIFRRTGPEAGAALTEYVAFAPDAPQLTDSERLWLATDEDLPYELYEGGYQMTQLAPPGGVRGASAYVYRPDTAVSVGSDLAVAVETNQRFRLKTYTQIAVLVFAEGRLQGHEMATRTESFSREAVLDVDAAGHLHLVWREGGGQTVYYATTAPEAKDVLDTLNREDVFGILLTGGMESLVGILFFPVAFIWLLPGLGLMGFWKLHISDDELSHPVTIFLFIISVALYETIKVLFLPTMITYVPFSTWVDVTTAWRQPLLIGVPLLIFAIAALVAARVYKRSSPSGLLAFFALAATDAILSLAVYGVNFLGVF